MRAALATTWIVGVGLLAPQIARGDSVVLTYTFPSPLLDYTSADGASFSQFNPAAGTLNSITLHTTATATWSGGAGTDLNLPPITPSPSVPEPSSASLLAVGLLGLGWISRGRLRWVP